MKKNNNGFFDVDCSRGRIVFNPDGIKAILQRAEKRKKIDLYNSSYTKPNVKKYSNRYR